MKIVKSLFQLVLVGNFTAFGIMKIVGTAEMVSTFTEFGFPMWGMRLTGMVELVAATAESIA